MTRTTRRRFLQTAAAAAAAPMVLPSRLFGPQAPGNALRIGCIGVGRMGMGDLKAVLARGLEDGLNARIVAVCDVDRNRREAAQRDVEATYQKKLPDEKPAVAAFADYRELLARDDIDAVTISTPEHWHALIAIATAKAKKAMYVQKPMTFTVREGQALVKAVREHKVVLQVGSQQRSDARFRQACELVRNGRLGRLRKIHVYLPPDVGSGDPKESAVPDGLDYDTWLGPAAAVAYAEQGVHPQKGYGRPGWLQRQQFCLGMITGWGSHMNDIAQWGHGSDVDGGIAEISATAEFPQRGLFDVHTRFRAEGRYADGVELVQETGDPAGVRFHGDEGWIFVRRGGIEASKPELLADALPPDALRLPVSGDHYRNWLECVRSGQDPICPVEVGHRSNTLCVVTHIAMKLGRKLRWDAAAEAFVDDAAADAMLDYPHRAPWTL